MRLDAAQQVLLAIYEETQQENPHLWKAVTARTLGIDATKFKVAVDKLESEGFIHGSLIITGDCCPVPRMVIIDNVKLTPYGMECAERILYIIKDIPFQAITDDNAIRQPWLKQAIASINEVCSFQKYKTC
ncbi:hypothetical protein [Dethiobacter alkaliphilus]|uniref:hypothetical protein n=1 Tax=Dethiobacter alkaliphilus TaxID=427926 RepID=UPI002225EE75|nr:hypothetical protein [Dethiobacter alkaliphilus]MCW3490434.1 hypothetical protein [Dethiobacter alkaliphilus]